MSAHPPRRSGRRLQAALLGAAFLHLPVVLALLWGQLQHPWFLDSLPAILLLASLPALLAGALVGALLAPVLGRGVGLRGATGTVAVELVLLVGMTGLWPRPDPRSDVDLLVMGVDGATFDVIDAMGDELPHLQTLLDQGVHADLLSMEPMFSPLLWATMSTGKTPEEHGIHGFHVQASDCRAARFWEIMASEGYDVGIYKWLVTYPPQRVEGFMVPAWLAPSTETWPEDLSFVKEIELSRRLERRQVDTRRSNVTLALEGIRHGLRFTTLARAVRVSLQERILGPSPLRSQRDGQLLRVWLDRDTAVWALHRYRPRVLTFTDYATDALGHRFWKYYEPDRFPGVSADEEARWGEVLPDAYRQADAVLGELLEQVGPQARVVVVSDHGFQAVGGGDAEGQFFAPRTEHLRGLLEQNVGEVEVSKLGHKVVVTMLGDLKPGALEALDAWLANLVQDSTGEPFYRTEPIPGDSRSLGLTLRDEYVTEERIASDSVNGTPLSEFVRLTEVYSGIHHERGVFVAGGPGLVPGLELADLTLLDVTPTLLALTGIPPARDLAGEVPVEMFEELPRLGNGPESYDSLVSERSFLGAEEGVNEAQLRALGYIE